MDRAHRSLAPPPKPNQAPRPFIVRMHHYQTRELVLRLAREKGQVLYKGIFTSFSRVFTSTLMSAPRSQSGERLLIRLRLNSEERALNSACFFLHVYRSIMIERDIFLTVRNGPWNLLGESSPLQRMSKMHITAESVSVFLLYTTLR